MYPKFRIRFFYLFLNKENHTFGSKSLIENGLCKRVFAKTDMKHQRLHHGLSKEREQKGIMIGQHGQEHTIDW